MYLDLSIGTHKIDLAALSEGEIVNQLGQLFHAQPKPGDTHDFTGLFDLDVNEQRQLSRGRVVVNVEGARLAATRRLWDWNGSGSGPDLFQ